MEPIQEENPPARVAPVQPREDDRPDVEYAGFWIRFLASVLDSILLLMVIVPLLLIFYGPEVLFVTESPGPVYDLINYLLPIVAVIAFWQYRSATPGKIMMGIYIVDANTLGHPSFGRLLLRYLGYYLSMLPLFLGFFWVAFDKRKQGFHDKIARTLVIKQPPLGTSPTAGPAAEGAARQEPSHAEEQDPPPAAPPPGRDPWKE